MIIAGIGPLLARVLTAWAAVGFVLSQSIDGAAFSVDAPDGERHHFLAPTIAEALTAALEEAP